MHGYHILCKRNKRKYDTTNNEISHIANIYCHRFLVISFFWDEFQWIFILCKNQQIKSFNFIRIFWRIYLSTWIWCGRYHFMESIPESMLLHLHAHIHSMKYIHCFITQYLFLWTVPKYIFYMFKYGTNMLASPIFINSEFFMIF